MYVEDRGLVYDATSQPAQRRIAFFSSLCTLDSGTILCSFQVGSGKHAPDSTIGICRSHDRGATWQELPGHFQTTIDGVPGSLAGGEIVEVVPGRLQVLATWFDRGDPARPLFDPVTEGILRSKLLLATSDDEGDTWGPWQELPTKGLTGCATTGPIIKWSDGTLAYAFESFKEFDDPRPARHAAWIIASRDGGRTGEPSRLVADDPRDLVYYWDQRLCPTSRDGEFVALFWTHDRAQQRDLNVHLRRLTIQRDVLHGEPVQSTSIRGQIAAPLVLDDNTLLAFVVDRVRPGTMKLWRSRDAGRTWPTEDCLLVHEHLEQAAVSQGAENIDFAQYWEDMGKWSFGHPAIRRLDPGRVLLAYYAGTPEAMSIHWSRVNLGDREATTAD
jgi:hypothetical protein